MQANALHLVNSCLLHPLNAECAILALRLLNNMLVNDTHLTETVLREIHLAAVIGVYSSHVQLVVQGEVANLFINLMHFLNDDQLLVRELVNRGVHELVLDLLANFKELEEDLVSQSLSMLLIAYEHHPCEVRLAIRRHLPTLQELAELTANAGVVEEIIRVAAEREEYV
jgi:hypothetical protein